ncbi:MAG TPA: hypothetical protein PKI90_09960 [bacterium]|nr:hypothetical protein [bacterium]
MAEITLERLYLLVENMADYLMTKVATKEEVNRLTERVDQLTERVDQLTERFDELTIRVDSLTVRVGRLEEQFEQFRTEVRQKFDQVLEGMDAQAGQLDMLRTELASQSHTLDVYNVRIGDLEEGFLGKRVRDEEEG